MTVRVLHLYSGNLYGGIERLLVTLTHERHLAPDMEPTFGLCFQGRLSDELIQTGLPVFDLGVVRFSRPWTVLRARWRLGRLLRREQFDVVVAHAAWPHAAFAKTVRTAAVHLAHWVHDSMTEVIDSRCGVFVPPNDPAALAEALGGLIANRTNRTALGDTGPARATELCDPKRQMGRVCELLREVIA